MRVTIYDLHLWAHHHAPTWARPLLSNGRVPSIHEVINGHDRAGEFAGRVHASNTLHLIRSMTKRQPLRLVLYHLFTTMPPPADPRRVDRCKKWLQRIDRDAAMRRHAQA